MFNIVFILKKKTLHVIIMGNYEDQIKCSLSTHFVYNIIFFTSKTKLTCVYEVEALGINSRSQGRAGLKKFWKPCSTAIL